MSTALSFKPNPFPQLAVASEKLGGLGDYQSSVFGRASYRLKTWSDGLVEAAAARAATVPRGLVMGVRGRFGSGKTHLLFQLTRAFEAAGASSEGAAVLPKAWYFKADSILPEAFYRNYVAAQQLTDDELKSLFARHIQVLLAERTASSAADSLGKVASEHVTRLAHLQPQVILDLLQANLLPVAGLPQEAQSRLEQVAPKLTPDLWRAYSAVTEEPMGDRAREWIRGGRLTEQEAPLFSITAPSIEGRSASVAALEFLLRAYRQAGYVLLVCLDEIERFVPLGGEIERDDQLTELKNLAELIAVTGHCLIAAGAQEAWDKLAYRKDVTDRFPDANVFEMKLESQECKKLVEKYCEARRYSPGDVISGEALDALIVAGEFTARRILTLAHDAFEESNGARIDLGRIQSLASRGDVLRRQADAEREVADIVRQEAEQRGLSVETPYTKGGVRYDFAVRDAGGVRLLAMVRRSSFRTDEVQAVAAATRMFRGAGSLPAGSRIATCLILLGYSSPDVRNTAAGALDRVIQYNPQTFRTDFGDFLGEATKPLPQPLAGSPDRTSGGDDAGVGPVEDGRSKAFDAAESAFETIGTGAGEEQERLSKSLRTPESVEVLGFSRERQLGLANRFDSLLSRLKDWVRQRGWERVADPDKFEPQPIEPEKALTALRTFNADLPSEHTVERLLLVLRQQLRNKRSGASNAIFLIQEIEYQHGKRAAALEPIIVSGWLRMYRVLPLPRRVCWSALTASLLAFGIVVWANIPDRIGFNEYKAALGNLYKKVQATDSPSQELAGDITELALNLGIDRDPGFQDVVQNVRLAYKSDALAAIRRARTSTPLQTSFWVSVTGASGGIWLGVLALSTAGLVVLAWLRRRRLRSLGL